MTTRHEFLAQLHELLIPRMYLEIGVHTGGSLALARTDEDDDCTAWGVDPDPLSPHRPLRRNETVFNVTSDEFFRERAPRENWPADLAFIDGMHLWEYALRDFLNIEQHFSHTDTVVVFDDVLPYNAEIASRTQPPGGDWTGDVWRVWQALVDLRPDLYMMLVDTFPTGSLVVWGLKSIVDNDKIYKQAVQRYGFDDIPPPPSILSREGAVSAERAIQILKEQLCQ